MLVRYQPKHQPAKGLWDQIRPTVLDLVIASRPGGPELALKYLKVAARHVAVQVAGGHTVDQLPELFSDRALTRTYGPTAVARGDDDVSQASPRSAATDLTLLRRMRATILPHLYGTARPLRQPAHQAKQPYSDTELARRLEFLFSNDGPRLNPARAVLLLGLATGLDGYESQSVCPQDVLVTDYGLVVRTEGAGSSQARPARLVPVLADFEDRLAVLVRSSGSGPLIGAKRDGTRRATSRAVEELPAHVRIHGGRARSWWTRELIRREAPVLALRQAGVALAGDKVLNSLSEGLLIPFDRFVTVIRAGAQPFNPGRYSGLDHFVGEYSWPLS